MTMTVGWPMSRVNAEGQKHELTRKQLHTYLLNYFGSGLRDFVDLLLGRSGIFPTGGTPLNLTAGVAADTIRISSGAGMIHNAADWEWPIVDWTTPGDIEVENALGRTYRVGMRLQSIPKFSADGVRQNRRTLNQIDYVVAERSIGELGHPDSVTDNGDGTVRLDVSTIMKAGGITVNHGDRAAKVWLTSAVDPDWTVALQTGTAEYGIVPGKYTIENLPDCGQKARTGVTSTTAADYWVHIPGPTVTTLNISATAAYLYLGNFVGAGFGGPIGAVDTTGIYRFGAVFGTLDADVWTLFRDVYTAPTRDGDGVANLPTPLQTLIDTHLNGGANKHDATEVDDETVGGFHGATVQATLDNLSTELTARERLVEYATTQAFIASGDDFGIVKPVATTTPLDQLWSNAGDANDQRIVADGEYLWGTTGAGPYNLMKLSRETGNLVSLSAGTWDSSRIATAGGKIYLSRTIGGATHLCAINRTTLTESYTVSLGALGTVKAIETDGYLVAVVLDTLPVACTLMLYADSGAALVATGMTHDHGAVINDVAMDGHFLAYGGDAGVGGATAGDELAVWTYFPALTLVDSLARGAIIDWVTLDGEYLVYAGDADVGGVTMEMLSCAAPSLGALWQSTSILNLNAVQCTGDGRFLVGEAGDLDLFGQARYATSGNAVRLRFQVWDALGPEIQAIAFDWDRIFVRGDLTGGKRLKCYAWRTDATLYRRVKSTEIGTFVWDPIHALAIPVNGKGVH